MVRLLVGKHVLCLKQHEPQKALKSIRVLYSKQGCAVRKSVKSLADRHYVCLLILYVVLTQTACLIWLSARPPPVTLMFTLKWQFQ